MSSERKQTDFLVIGTGIAGLTAAHHLSKFGEVVALTKGKLKEANTYWAQGGIAAVLEKEDTFESHIEDTLVAGAHHNDEKAVRYLVEHAPKAIRFLKEIGVQFLDEPGLEGGHSRARVWRTSDFTGQDILNQLIKTVAKNRSISILEEADAVELIVQDGRCVGAFVRIGDGEDVEPVMAQRVVLATGGCGRLYGRTTNTPGSGGDGLALALKAGLALKDLEFMQFHPTAYAQPDEGRYFLLTEGLRGFGAKVFNHRGEPFLNQFHPKAELAPRDILSRAIFFEQMNGPVYLDMRRLDAKALRIHFPNIDKRLKGYGLDMTSDLIPITPVAHYSCGGIPVNLKSETELQGLYAIGEVACTGVHGANRLASNSLLEAVVFAESLADYVSQSETQSVVQSVAQSVMPKISVEPIGQVKGYAQRIGNIMWEQAGIVRTVNGLEQAKLDIASISSRDYRVQNRQLVCEAILDACLSRTESLGCHYIAPDLN